MTPEQRACLEAQAKFYPNTDYGRAITALLARVEELEGALSRYEWLKLQHAKGARGAASISFNIGHDWITPDDIDRAVDDARGSSPHPAAQGTGVAITTPSLAIDTVDREVKKEIDSAAEALARFRKRPAAQGAEGEQ